MTRAFRPCRSEHRPVGTQGDLAVAANDIHKAPNVLDNYRVDVYRSPGHTGTRRLFGELDTADGFANALEDPPVSGNAAIWTLRADPVAPARHGRSAKAARGVSLLTRTRNSSTQVFGNVLP